MPQPAKGARLGGSPAHERIILANLASQLFEHGKIVTTEAKAKRLRPVAEKLITKAKRGDIHARREVLKTVRDKGVVHVLFTEIAPTFEDRPGGYTRITKVGPRKGDNAPMALIELVTEPVAAKTSTAAPAAAARPPRRSPSRARPRRTARRAPTARPRRTARTSPRPPSWSRAPRSVTRRSPTRRPRATTPRPKRPPRATRPEPEPRTRSPERRPPLGVGAVSVSGPRRSHGWMAHTVIVRTVRAGFRQDARPPAAVTDPGNHAYGFGVRRGCIVTQSG